jgi:hypothetical protein
LSRPRPCMGCSAWEWSEVNFPSGFFRKIHKYEIS